MKAKFRDRELLDSFVLSYLARATDKFITAAF